MTAAEAFDPINGGGTLDVDELAPAFNASRPWYSTNGLTANCYP